MFDTQGEIQIFSLLWSNRAKTPSGLGILFKGQFSSEISSAIDLEPNMFQERRLTCSCGDADADHMGYKMKTLAFSTGNVEIS